MEDKLLINLSKNIELSKDINFCNLLASELHTFYIKTDILEKNIMNIIGKSALDENIILMPAQLDVLQEIIKSDNCVVSAPTSFGKSFLILEYIKRLKEKQNLITYIVHTKALCNEVTNNFKKYFNEDYNIINDFEDIQINGNNILIMISDGKNVFEFDNEIDLLIVDEAYNLDKRHSKNRFLSIYNSYRKLMIKSKKCILIGPFIKNLIGEESIKYRLIKTNYSPVGFKIYEKDENLKYKDASDCFIDKIINNENTIGFINSKSKIYHEMSKILSMNLPDIYEDAFIKWMDEFFPSFWLLPKLMRKGISIYHSSFPAYINLYNMKKFNTGIQRGLLTTSALLEGVNTSAKNIVVYDTYYNGEQLTPFQFFNLCGRAGRLNKEIIGYIYNFGSKYEDLYEKKALDLFIGCITNTVEEEFDIGKIDSETNIYKEKIEKELLKININFEPWYEEFKFYFSSGETLLQLISLYNNFKIEFKKQMYSSLLKANNKDLNKNKILRYIYEEFISKTKYKYIPSSRYKVIDVLEELMRSSNNGMDFNLKNICRSTKINGILKNYVSIEEKNQYIVEVMKTGYEYIPYELFYCSTILNEFIHKDTYFNDDEKEKFYESYYVRIITYLKCDNKKNELSRYMADKGILPTIIAKVEKYIKENSINIEVSSKNELINLIRIIINDKIYLEEYEKLNIENIII